MTNTISCLDHGFVSLVDHMGSDLSIVRSARVSVDAAWRAGEDEGKDARLIHRLWRDKHTSPFESVVFTFEVMAPIFVFRQWHRHRTQSYNELSARYKELPETYYLPNVVDVGMQSKDNKQGRSTVMMDAERIAGRKDEIDLVNKHCIAAFDLYHSLLLVDWPRELARMVLPVNTYSHMFATMNLLNLFRFLTLRCDSHAQYEIRVYANAMLELIKPICPVAVEAWSLYA